MIDRRYAIPLRRPARRSRLVEWRDAGYRVRRNGHTWILTQRGDDRPAILTFDTEQQLTRFMDCVAESLLRQD